MGIQQLLQFRFGVRLPGRGIERETFDSALMSARSVLELDKDELIRRADLEEETINEVLRILRSEFED